MDTFLPITILCLSSLCGLPFLYVAGISFIDPLSYTEFFDELQQTLGIDPPRINVKNQLWAHRIIALMILMLSTCGCVFGAWQFFLVAQ